MHEWDTVRGRSSLQPPAKWFLTWSLQWHCHPKATRQKKLLSVMCVCACVIYARLWLSLQLGEFRFGKQFGGKYSCSDLIWNISFSWVAIYRTTVMTQSANASMLIPITRAWHWAKSEPLTGSTDSAWPPNNCKILRIELQKGGALHYIIFSSWAICSICEFSLFFQTVLSKVLQNSW